MARCVPALIQAALHNFSDGSVYQLPHQISVFLEIPLALQIILAGTFKCALISEIKAAKWLQYKRNEHLF